MEVHARRPASAQLGRYHPPLAPRSLGQVLVIDSSVVLPACIVVDGFAIFRDEELLAPPLLWSEVRSALHEAQWRGDIDRDLARASSGRLHSAPITLHAEPGLWPAAWDLADRLGWAKTYDAEFVALAQLFGCRLVTLDARLRRGAARLGFVIGPDEL